MQAVLSPEEVAEILTLIDDTPPMLITRMSEWSPHTDPHWFVPENWTIADLYPYTRQSPNIIRNGSTLYVEYVGNCPGDECEGMLLSRHGAMGCLGREVPCPYHMARYVHTSNVNESASLFAEGRRRRYEMVAEANIPLFYQPYTVHNWPGEDPLASMRAKQLAAAELLNRMVLVVGNQGVGKTALVCAVLQARIHGHGDSGLYLTSAEYLEGLRPGLDADEAMASRVRRVRTLVIDDLGNEGMTEWGLAQLGKLITHRQAYKLATMLVTSLWSPALWEQNRWEVPKVATQTIEDVLGATMMEHFTDREVFEVLYIK